MLVFHSTSVDRWKQSSLLIFLFLVQCWLPVNCQISFGGNEGNRPPPNSVQGQQPPPQQQQQPGQPRFDIVFDDVPVVSNPSCVTPTQKPGLCKPLAQCAIFYAEIPGLLDNPCDIGNGQSGICCPLKDNERFKGKPRPQGVGADGVLSPPPPPQVVIPRINQQQLQSAADVSIQHFQERQANSDTILFVEKQTIQQGTPAAAHQRFFTTTNAILDKGKDAQLNIETSMTLSADFKLSALQGTFALPRFSAKGTSIENTCPPVATCRPNNPYRTMDGSCNNRQNPDWGKAGVAFQRILPPKYADGVSAPRALQANGVQLPSPRSISTRYIQDENQPANFTLMLMQWGQFLDHDLTHTPIVKGPNSTGISCCQNGRHLPPNRRHPDCLPIDIPQNDPFFSTFGQQCMEMVRSLPAPRRECNFGPREQMNQITGYIDGSNVYGSSDDRARSLREFVGGRLSIQNTRATRGRNLLPANPSECSDSQRQRFCFRAGDSRANEQVELAVMHTIWVREHNRIARALQQLNPNWSDEILYQETRRIVIAEMQHIVYNEYLPLVLGPEYMHLFNMTPAVNGHTLLYNPETDPTITNEFATAAYRFGHTLVQGVIQEVNQFGAVSSSLPFAKTQFSPFSLYDSFDSLIRGLTTQNSQRFDHFVTSALTNHLFEGNSQFGLDLMSLNIQRGRDHGLPPYNDFREVCGYKRVQSWGELANFMQPKAIENLQSLYQDVNEIDLFVGGIGEIPLPGALLGPTFVCLVGDQFARLRRGDRFFYEEQTARFTLAQLNQIRKVSLARVVCDNSDDIPLIQPLLFQQASFLNKRVPCNSPNIQGIDLGLWRDSSRNQGQQQQQRPPPRQQQNFQPGQGQGQRPAQFFRN